MGHNYVSNFPNNDQFNMPIYIVQSQSTSYKNLVKQYIDATCSQLHSPHVEIVKR